MLPLANHSSSWPWSHRGVTTLISASLASIQPSHAFARFGVDLDRKRRPAVCETVRCAEVLAEHLLARRRRVRLSGVAGPAVAMIAPKATQHVGHLVPLLGRLLTLLRTLPNRGERDVVADVESSVPRVMTAALSRVIVTHGLSKSSRSRSLRRRISEQTAAFHCSTSSSKIVAFVDDGDVKLPASSVSSRLIAGSLLGESRSEPAGERSALTPSPSPSLRSGSGRGRGAVGHWRVTRVVTR